MVILTINEDRYRYGIGQFGINKRIKLFGTIDNSFYSHQYTYSIS